MNLKEVKSYNNSKWLKHLELRTVYDTDLIKEQWKWLVEQAELLDKISNRWIEIETNGTQEEANDFYSYVQDVLTPEPD